MAQAWLAWSDGAPVGCAVVCDWMNFNRGYKVRHVHLLYVKEQYRSCGVGRALMAAVTADAVRKKFGRIDLGVAKKNKSAFNFYLELGFERRKRYAHKLTRTI